MFCPKTPLGLGSRLVHNREGTISVLLLGPGTPEIPFLARVKTPPLGTGRSGGPRKKHWAFWETSGFRV